MKSRMLFLLLLLSGLCSVAVARQDAASALVTQGPGEPPFVVHSDLVTLNVTVTDTEGRHVSGLSRSDFAVYDEGAPQEISFFGDEDEPASVGVLFDLSGSMSGNKIERAREALAGLIQTSHPADEFFLIGFAAQPQLILNRTRDGEAVLAKFTYTQPRGETALFDAVAFGVEKVLRGAHRKRAVILISDGEDNNSRRSLGALRRQLQESGVVVYAVGVSENWLPKRGEGEATLKRLAASTGGEAFFPTRASGVGEAFERIALSLRHQYSIGYRPSNFAPDGRWRRVKVKVTPPPGVKRLHVRAKEGYFAGLRPHR